MAVQQFQPQVQVTTDTQGRATFTFPPPTAQNLAVLATVSVNSGASGNFEAFIGPNSAGSWSGAAQAGPYYYQGSQTFKISATGLLPSTTYTASLQGIVDFAENLDATVPTPLGAPGLAAVDSIVNVPALALAPGASKTYQYFPCVNFAALRLSVQLASGGPIVVECFWYNSDLTAPMGYRRYIVGSTAPTLYVVVPHLGDMLAIKLSNQTGTALIAADSSGGGHDGLYNDVADIAFNVPGLVTGDAAISVTPAAAQPGVLLSSFVGNPFAGSFSIVAFIDDGAGTSDIILADIRAAGGAPLLLVTWRHVLSTFGDLLFTRNYSTVASDTTLLNSGLARGPHVVIVSYDATIGQLNWSVDGTPLSLHLFGPHAMTQTPTTGQLYALTTPGVPTAATLDEWAIVPAVVPSATGGALKAQAGNFANYTAAMLALNPYAYFHLDQILGTPAVCSACATHTTQPLAMFGGLDLANTQPTTIPPATTVTMLAPPYIFGGGAILSFNPSNAENTYAFALQAQEPDGTWNSFVRRTGSQDPGRQLIPIFMPAAPVRLQVTNTETVAQQMDAALEYDLQAVG